MFIVKDKLASFVLLFPHEMRTGSDVLAGKTRKAARIIYIISFIQDHQVSYILLRI